MASEKTRRKTLLSFVTRLKENSELIWLTIYADLMTNLMLFFLMLFAVTRLSVNNKSIVYEAIEDKFSKTVDAFEGSKQEDILEEEIIDEEKVREELRVEEEALAERMKEYIGNKGLEKDAEIRISEQKIRIMLSSPVLYDPGKAELKSSSFPIFHEVAELIRSIPNRIIIEGHTDDVPIHNKEFQSNWELSAARAFSVVRHFIEEEAMDPERLAGLGYGEFRPLFPNDSVKNRSKNRRVEVNIIRVSH